MVGTVYSKKFVVIPSNLTSAKVRFSTFSVKASISILITDWLQTRVEGGQLIPDFRFLPA